MATKKIFSFILTIGLFIIIFSMPNMPNQQTKARRNFGLNCHRFLRSFHLIFSSLMSRNSSGNQNVSTLNFPVKITDDFSILEKREGRKDFDHLGHFNFR